MRTNAFSQKGLLCPEADAPIDAFRKRIPDISYYTLEQVWAAKKGIKVVPSFAIEILSHSEAADDVEQKIQSRLVYFPKRQTNLCLYCPDRSKNLS